MNIDMGDPLFCMFLVCLGFNLGWFSFMAMDRAVLPWVWSKAVARKISGRAAR